MNPLRLIPQLKAISRRTALLFLCFCLPAIAADQHATKPARLELTPCELPGVKEKVRCGTYEVFEDRAARKGRKITLKIVVAAATGPTSAPDPFVYIPGGPGSSATEDAPGVAELFAGVRARRDLVFIDQRGTGGSHPLNCNFFDPADLQSYLGYFFPLDDVRKCRQELELKANLKLYTTPIAMDDLDEVRAALGYERVNLFGASYGTRAALVYLKRHPHITYAPLRYRAWHRRTSSCHAISQRQRARSSGNPAECAADEPATKRFPPYAKKQKPCSNAC
jgi:pimeloyl-ACP methyl ester carboxylesterase